MQHTFGYGYHEVRPGNRTICYIGRRVINTDKAPITRLIALHPVYALVTFPSSRCKAASKSSQQTYSIRCGSQV